MRAKSAEILLKYFYRGMNKPNLRNRLNHDLTRPAAWLYDQAYLLLVLAILFWCGNLIIGRAVHADIPPVALAFWRWLTGFMILLPFARKYLTRDWSRVQGHWWITLTLAALGIAAFNTLLYTGLQSTTAINGALLQSMMPVIIVVMSFLFFGEIVMPRQLVGIVISLGGVVTIILRGNWAQLATLALNRGDLWVLAAVVSYAAYSALLRRRPPLHALSFLAITFGAGTVMLIPFYLWETVSVGPPSFDRITLSAVLYVAVFPSIMAYLCFNRGVELIGANRAGLFLHLMPVFGSVLAVLLLGERFRLFHTAGIGLILTGIFLASRSR